MGFSDRLQQLMFERNVSNTSLGDFVGVSNQAVSKWKNGAVPKSDKIQKIADYFGVPISFLLGSPSPIPPDTHSIPIIGTVACGRPIQVYEVNMGTVEIPEAYVPYASDLYAFRASGDSMYPVIMEDDILICRRNPDSRLINNKIYIFENNDGEATVKKVHADNNSLLLIPLNPSHPVITYTKEQIKTQNIRHTYELLQMVRSF